MANLGRTEIKASPLTVLFSMLYSSLPLRSRVRRAVRVAATFRCPDRQFIERFKEVGTPFCARSGGRKGEATRAV